MSGQSFTFPPPPPAPPQASQSYPAYSQPPQGHRGYRSRENTRCRGSGGSVRGNSREGPRGGSIGFSPSTPGYGGYGIRDHRQSRPQVAEYGAQTTIPRRDEYALSNYPAVQMPQYPPNLRQDYGRHMPNVPANSGYSSYGNGVQQDFNGTPSYQPNGYGSPVSGFQPPVQAGLLPHKFGGNVNQPVPMDTTIRMGLDGGRQSRQSQYLPQPSASGMISFPDGPPSSTDPASQQSFSPTFQSGLHNSPNQFPIHRGRGRKRGYGEAFGKPRNQNPKPRAAPSVPNFGSALPLPVKPPAPQDQGRRAQQKKKKRKHNQLGLTPKTEEHESSEEEEDDIDEESRLAAAVAGSGIGPQLLQFEYKGRTSILSSSSEIAAWIEERKKKFPTRARAVEAAERKRQRDEAQKAAGQARREGQEKQRLEAKERQRLKTEAEEKQKKPKEDAEDAAAKAKRKVEKLRKQLEKEEKRAAKAEAKVSKTGTEAHEEAESSAARKRKRSDSRDSIITKVADGSNLDSKEDNQLSAGHIYIKSESDIQIKENAATAVIHDPSSNDVVGERQEATRNVPDPLTPTSQPPAPDDVDVAKVFHIDHKGDPDGLNQATGKTSTSPDQPLDAILDQATQQSSISMSDASSETLSTDSEDLTSSSGSSSTASGSNDDDDDDGDDDAPDQASSKRNGPEIVAPPKREKPKAICKDFLKSGRCRRGDNCRYRHELPKRGSRAAGRKEIKKTQERTERVGLHQRLVEQEMEKEDTEVLRAIMYLGAKGLLDPEVPKGSTET